jgi:hypothetical protein
MAIVTCVITLIYAMTSVYATVRVMYDKVHYFDSRRLTYAISNVISNCY